MHLGFYLTIFCLLMLIYWMQSAQMSFDTNEMMRKVLYAGMFLMTAFLTSLASVLIKGWLRTMPHSNQDDITICGLDDTRRVVKAPPHFDWLHYPEKLDVLDRHFVYTGCQDSIPVYQEVK